MKRAVRFSEPALADIDRIWSYLADFGVDIADRFVERLKSATGRLHEHPLSGPSVGAATGGLRRLSAHGHILVYIVLPDEVLVVRVFDAREDWHSAVARGL